MFFIFGCSANKNINTTEQTTIKPLNFVVTGDKVRIRTSPGAEAPVIGYANKGDIVEAVTSNIVLDAKSNKKWMNIQTSQPSANIGWICVDFLKEMSEQNISQNVIAPKEIKMPKESKAKNKPSTENALIDADKKLPVKK